MSDTDQIAQRLAAYLASLSEDDRVRMNTAQLEESERQHTAFHDAFAQGHCSICDDALTAFDEKKPCLHWFLRPAGVKKKHYEAVAKDFGMMSIQSWLRWVANEGGWAKNIADTADDEHIVQVTARYGDFEWSISCGKSDFTGHAGKRSAYPHYHFQMSINGRPFISYSDFHFRIPDNEIAILKAMEVTGVKSKFVFGESYDDLIAMVEPEWIVNAPIDRDLDPSGAAFNMNTILRADEGTTISGDDLAEMIANAKRDNVSFASRAHTIPNARGQTFISEGPGVIDPAPREGGRGSKQKGAAS